MKTAITTTVCLLVLTTTLFSCKNHSKDAGEAASAVVTDSTVQYYPINEFFSAQLKTIDSSNTITKVVTDINNKKNSFSCTPSECRILAEPFTQIDLTGKNIQSKFKESVFDDATTGSYTFNYTALDTAQALQSLDILLDKESQQPKRVFANKIFYSNDTTITQKLSWKADQEFSVLTIRQARGGQETHDQLTVSWK